MRRLLSSLVLAAGPSSMSAPCRADDLNGLRSCVSAAGDVDRDGAADFALASRDGVLPEAVWLLSGMTGSVIRVLRGRKSGDGFGSALAAAGDVDRDGFPDLLIAANGGPDPDYRPNTGSPTPSGGVGPWNWSRFRRLTDAYVLLLSGRDGSVIHEFMEGEVDGLLGLSVAAAPDVNGDGFTDVLIGSPSRRTAGAVEVRSGKDGSRIHRIEGAHGTPRDVRDWFGAAVLGLGDVDGDGFGDFVVGSPMKARGDDEHDRPGCATLFSGRGAKPIFVAYGDRNDSQLGWSLARISDVDGDGGCEVLAGGLNRCVEVLLGSNLGSIRSFPSRAGYGYCDSFASSLDSLGDVDGDGLPEMLVGARECGGSIEIFDEGYAQALSLRSGSPVLTLHLSQTEGVDVCGIGDVDGDRMPDIVLAIGSAFVPDTTTSPATGSAGPVPHTRWRGTARLRSGATGALIRELDLGELRSQAGGPPEGPR